MQTSHNTVSVVIPAYNVEHYIGRAIDSVLAQSRPAQEVIVVDDGSTDGTADVIKRYGSDVQYIYQQKAGASSARNRGIENASSEWIAFLDADDEYLPQKLETQMPLMERNPDLLWSYTNYIIRPADGNNQRLAHNIDKVKNLIKGKEFFDDCLFAYSHGVPTHTITLMARRKTLQEAGMFLKDQPWAQDADLAFRLAYRWPRVGYISQPLSVHYFQRPGGITEENWNLMQQRCDFVKRHLELSAGHGRQEEFRPCAEMLLERWGRQILRIGRFDQAEQVLSEVKFLLPKSMLREMRLCRAFPHIMPLIFKLYHRTKSKLKNW